MREMRLLYVTLARKYTYMCLFDHVLYCSLQRARERSATRDDDDAWAVCWELFDKYQDDSKSQDSFWFQYFWSIQ